MKLIYICGPYRAATTFAISENIAAARSAAAEILRLGAYPVTPHLLTAHMDGLVPDEQFLAGAVELMRRCDAVLVLPGWGQSAGSTAEVAEADSLGMRVFHQASKWALEDWLRDRAAERAELNARWSEILSTLRVTENADISHGVSLACDAIQLGASWPGALTTPNLRRLIEYYEKPETPAK